MGFKTFNNFFTMIRSEGDVKRVGVIVNLMRNASGSLSSWLERGGSLWRTACNGGGREIENAQRGKERKKRGRTLKNNEIKMMQGASGMVS